MTIGMRESDSSAPGAQRVTVGNFIGICVRESLLIGMITDVSLQTDMVAHGQGFTVAANLDVLGEIQNHGKSNARFQRGVVNHPAIGINWGR